MVNTQKGVVRVEFSSSMDSVTYGDILSKLFAESILGTRVHTSSAHFSLRIMAEKPPVVLTIAGFDPSSGAGVTADIKTIAAHGCYGVACITALTVQSTAGVRRVEALDPGLVSETLGGAGRRHPHRSGPYRDAG